MREGPERHCRSGPSSIQKLESAHRLPLELRRDLLPTIVDLRRLPQILEIRLQPLLADLLDARRAQLLLLRLERDLVGGLARIHAKDEHAVLLADRNADRAD